MYLQWHWGHQSEAQVLGGTSGAWPPIAQSPWTYLRNITAKKRTEKENCRASDCFVGLPLTTSSENSGFFTNVGLLQSSADVRTERMSFRAPSMANIYTCTKDKDIGYLLTAPQHLCIMIPVQKICKLYSEWSYGHFPCPPVVWGCLSG